jgi:hypothetical protein
MAIFANGEQGHVYLVYMVWITSTEPTYHLPTKPLVKQKENKIRYGGICGT